MSLRRRLAVLAALTLIPTTASAQETTYAVDSAQSTVTIQVGRAGLLKFAGHAHEVVAPRVQGEVVADPGQLSRSRVSLAFGAAGLKVTGSGEPAQDVPKVQAKMLGPEVLDVARFPTVTFRSRSVSGRSVVPDVYELQVTGELSLHGVTRSLVLPVRVELSGGRLTATGRATLKHSDYGMDPVSVAGVVKVKNELGVEFRIVARAAE